MSQPIAAPPPPIYSAEYDNVVMPADRVDRSAAGTELSFGDFIDMINPLQHLPLVSTIYRAITGDEIGSAARSVGALIYGGPVGMVSAGLASAFEEASGGSMGDMAVALLKDITGSGEEGSDIAQKPGPRPGVRVSALEDLPSAGAPSMEQAMRQVAERKAEPVPKSVTEPSSAAPIALPNARELGRVSQAVLDAHRDQAQLLLANLQGTAPRHAPAAGNESKPVPVQALAPALADARPTTAPQRGNPAAWFPQAMARGLDKYMASHGATGAIPPRAR